jgi:hypothetical protein
MIGASRQKATARAVKVDRRTVKQDLFPRFNRWLGAALLGLLLAGCTLQQGTPTPLPTPDAPAVEFRTGDNALINGSRICAGQTADINLLATDPAVGVARIQLLVDDTPHADSAPEAGAVPAFAVTMSWTAQGIGLHTLTAFAFRQDGRSSPPETIVVEVLSC